MASKCVSLHNHIMLKTLTSTLNLTRHKHCLSRSQGLLRAHHKQIFPCVSSSVASPSSLQAVPLYLGYQLTRQTPAVETVSGFANFGFHGSQWRNFSTAAHALNATATNPPPPKPSPVAPPATSVPKPKPVKSPTTTTDQSRIEVSGNEPIFKRIIESFPGGIEMAFAYGSAVFQQQNHPDRSKNMLDFILIVDDPMAWHKENLSRNRAHYSSVKYFGSHGVSYLQEGGAGIVWLLM